MKKYYLDCLPQILSSKNYPKETKTSRLKGRNHLGISPTSTLSIAQNCSRLNKGSLW
jgi:hypothetical protein